MLLLLVKLIYFSFFASFPLLWGMVCLKQCCWYIFKRLFSFHFKFFIKTKSFRVDSVLLLFRVCLTSVSYTQQQDWKRQARQTPHFCFQKMLGNIFNLSLEFILQKKIMSRTTFYIFGDLAPAKAINLQWKAKFEALNTWCTPLSILIEEKTWGFSSFWQRGVEVRTASLPCLPLVCTWLSIWNEK